MPYLAPPRRRTSTWPAECSRIEADAVADAGRRIWDDEFAQAVALILACRGRVIVSGIGKSGHIARKIAATMASTGTPAYFVHPAEAVHGDLGMITRDDVLIALSNSGESDELLTIVPLVKRQGGKLIAITGNPDSSLAREADVHLDARVDRGSLPAQPRPDRQHHRGAGAGRRAGGGAARRARLRRRGFRPLASRAARSAASC